MGVGAVKRQTKPEDVLAQALGWFIIGYGILFSIYLITLTTRAS